MNRVGSYWSRIAVVGLSAASVAAQGDEKPLFAGLWNATVRVGDVEVPFRFEIDGDGASVRGSFFNGDVRTTRRRPDGSRRRVDSELRPVCDEALAENF